MRFHNTVGSPNTKEYQTVEQTRCLTAMHEVWHTARLPKPRQGKSTGRGRVGTTDLPINCQNLRGVFHPQRVSSITGNVMYQGHDPRESIQNFTVAGNRSALAPFRCLTAMPPEESTRAGILSGRPSLSGGS
ncbi:hypothetical protein T265_09053 [Opisthorchis viverrini]|uniref:Uncharacterized protein n=1 Tax=Opisthorchis viverrini TaxID=6198 RepID=A0A074Z705_OPIVI|nr:hypothetical protein T265_09053 [Opisthorchis viverrini]KER22971.1 hypothetical protein T265_09053 [Opisthorchis viverrini]